MAVRRLDRFDVDASGDRFCFHVERLFASEAEDLGRTKDGLAEEKDWPGLFEFGRDFVVKYARDIEVLDDAAAYLDAYPAKGVASDALSAEHMEARRQWLDAVVATIIPAAVLRLALEMKLGNASALVVSDRSRASSAGPAPSSEPPSDAGNAPMP